jgi:regulator of sirC expression with transglutaminase-like and TPR domain
MIRRPESEIALDLGALLIAAHAHPELDIDARLAQLDALADEASATSADELSEFLFATGRFSGNTVDYADPANSYLDAVLDRRLGLPITLSVLMVEVGRRAGIILHGVGMPGHFLVGTGAGEWYDPFGGGHRLDTAACARRFAESHGAASFRPEFLLPTRPTRILDRMLANLQRTLLTRAPASAAWVLRLRLEFPEIAVEQRAELAEALGRLGQFGEAARALDEVARELGAGGAENEARATRATEAAQRLRARAN